MSDLQIALGWLTQYSPSRITFNTRLRLNQMENPTIAQADFLREQTASLLLPSVRADAFEKQELLLRTACLQHARGWIADSYASLAQAAAIHLPEANRVLVAQWMLGLVEWQINERESAYARCTAVRDAFKQSLAAAEDQKQQPGIRYCTEVLDEIGVAFSGSVEEAFASYNAFSATRIQGLIRQLHDRALEEMRRLNFTPASLRLDDMIRQARRDTDRLVLPEVLVYCALDLLHMGDPAKAIEYLVEAVAKLPPESHQQAVALWMRGAIRVTSPVTRIPGVQDWETAQAIFESLQVTSERQRQPEMVRWYAECAKNLRAAQQTIDL